MLSYDLGPPVPSPARCRRTIHTHTGSRKTDGGHFAREREWGGPKSYGHTKTLVLYILYFLYAVRTMVCTDYRVYRTPTLSQSHINRCHPPPPPTQSHRSQPHTDLFFICNFQRLLAFAVVSTFLHRMSNKLEPEF